MSLNDPPLPELEASLNDAPCGFIRFQDDGTILEANTTLLAMLGYEFPELTQQPLTTILAPGTKVFFQTHLFPSLRMQGKVKELYLSLIDKSGKTVPVLMNAVRHNRGDGEVNDCVIVEIVKREQFENALLAARKEAEKATQTKDKALSKLESALASLAKAKEETDAASQAKDDFLAALSHELRTPLTPVLMTASALQSDESLPPNVREQMAMIRRNVELEATLIDDLLDVTRIRNGKLTLNPTNFDLHQLLDHTRETVSTDFDERNISFHETYQASRHFVSGDSPRIGQVIWNFIKNAVKFSHKGGAIYVTTANDENNRIVVTVKDNGVGIPQEQLSVIFNSFEQGHATGKHSFGGLGLGLSICHAIVSAHGGEITAQSDGQGLGASFSFMIGTVDSPDKALQEQSPSSNISPQRILLIEDHDTTRLVITHSLENIGHQVVSLGTLSEATAAFEPDAFDLIISDIGLPDGSGLDFMRKIRAISDIPSLALSGYGMNEDIERMKSAGFTSHLVKPIKMDQLLNAIQSALN